MGVVLLYNPSAQLTYLAEVEFAPCTPWVSGQTVPPYGYVSHVNPNTRITYYYINNSTSPLLLPTPPNTYSQTPTSGLWPVGGQPLDIRPNTDLVPLPSGIGVQTICNCSVSSSQQRTSDGYLNFGVILFDGYGRMVSQNYGVSQYSRLITTSGMPAGSDYPVPGQNVVTNDQFGVASQFGLVVFQREAFVSQGFPTNDAAYSPQTVQYTSASQLEENWLDQNATPLLINRYTGTLIKGE
jgi:hypothetical protein